MTDAQIARMVRTGGVIVLVWTVAVVIGTAGHYFGMMMHDTMPMSHILGDSISMWCPWIPGTAIALWLHRRAPFESPRWPAGLAGHVATLAVIFVAQIWMSVTIGHITGHVVGDLGTHLRGGLTNLLPYDALLYAGVLAVAYMLDFSAKYRERALRASQLEAQLQRARMEALQAQLQPHFLFNALNSIAMLVRRDRRDDAVNSIVGFSELLRYVLDEAGTVDVPLDEELTFVRRYLDLEKVRYGDRLQVSIDVSADARRSLAPNLVLQPLVENALKHGIARQPDGGSITIRGRRERDRLVIVVDNDGPPLGAGFTIAESDGVGLRNLHERLQAVPGTSALRLGAREDGRGVVATVDLPYRETTTAAAGEKIA
jgi:hypothetical protein